MQSTVPGGAGGFTWKDFAGKASKANWLLTLGAMDIQNASGTFRLSTSKLAFSPRLYSNAWRGNQYVKTFSLGKVGAMASRGLVGLSIGVDFISYVNGDISGAKFAANTGIGLWGLTGVGTIPAAVYFGLEAFYPGGARGAMNDQVKMQNELNEITDYKFRLIPFGPK